MSKCPKCDSSDRMDHLRVLTEGGDYLTVEVYANPRALVLKESATSKLQAGVCGSCGYTELYSVDPGALVAATKKAEKRRTQ